MGPFYFFRLGSGMSLQEAAPSPLAYYASIMVTGHTTTKLTKVYLDPKYGSMGLAFLSLVFKAGFLWCSLIFGERRE